MNNTQVRIVDAVLTGSLGLIGKDYIADKVAPPVFFNKDVVQVPEWGKEHMYVGAMQRSPGAKVIRQESTLSQTPYIIKQYAIEEPLPVEYVQIADSSLQLELSISRKLEDKVARQKELTFANLFTNTANFGNDAPATVTWDTVATAVPISDIQTGIDDVTSRLGYRPNTIVMDYASYDAMKFTDQVKDWRNITTSGTLSVADFAKMFEVDNIYIGYGNYNDGTDPDGQGAVVPVYGNFCAIMYVEPRPSPVSMSWAYQLGLKGYPVVEKYVEEKTRSTVIRHVCYYAYAVVAPDAGYLITNTL